MNNEQYLLAKLAEECNEVSQMAIKCMQFGLHEIKPGQNLTNLERLKEELNDLLAAIQMLNDECGLMFLPGNSQILAKIYKVDRFRKYSVHLGKVTKNG